MVYTLRINGTSFKPKVFKEGAYTIKVGEGEKVKTLSNVASVKAGEEKTIEVSLGAR